MMNALGRLVGWLARRTRPQFHRVILLIVGWPFFLLMMYAIGWLITGIYWLAGEKVGSRFPVIALMSGLMIVGELARAIVKLWLGKSPDQRSILATAVAGAVTGALFDVYMIVMWGNDGAVEVLLAAGLVAAAYVVVDICCQWEARRKARSRPPGVA